MKLLRIDSSARASSVSRQLTGEFVEVWKKSHSDGEVKECDLSAMTLPHITDDWSATFGDPGRITPSQRAYLSTSDTFVSELLNADVIVIGSPMYNFGISWKLKAWIDQVVRLGKTIAYGPAGSRGLLNGKKVVVITSRGASYSSEPGAPNFDFQESYLKRILGFMGLRDVTFIHADNQRRGEQAERGRAVAIEQIGRVVSQILEEI